MKITTEFVPDNAKAYLTAGKEYNLFPTDDDCGFIADDQGDKIFVHIDECEHLDNRDWSICDAK